MVHKKGTVNKVIVNSSNSVVILDYFTRTLNIGLYKVKQMLHVTTECGIRTAMNPISRRNRTNNVDLRRKYISGRWYVDWMPAATKSITQCRVTFVYSNGTFPEVYQK